MSNREPLDGIDAPVLDGNGSYLSGPAWRIELYGGLTTDSLTPTLSIQHSYTREIVGLRSPGYFVSTSELVPEGVLEAGWAWLQVRVWSGDLGATYEDVVDKGLGGYGESSLLYLKGGSPDAHVLPTPLVGLQSFSVRPIVPEPATWALLVVGGLGLCWAKRRRRPLRRLQMDERPTPMHES